MCGHSLGGYISSVYTLRYPEHVESLLLLSPVGIPEKPADFSNEEIVQRFDTWKGKLYAKVVLGLWERKYTPFQPLRVTGSWMTQLFLKHYLKNRMSAIEHEEEFQNMKNYLHQVFCRPGSGEFAVYTILSPGSWAKNPLFYRLQAI